MKTGYEDWDQNLKTLSQSLFPDPSLAARGYYYGSEARQKQLESNKLIDQQNWRNRYGMMTQGGAQPGPLTFQQPTNVPGAAPISAPPANLPMAGGGPASMAAAVTNMTPAQAADMVPAAVAPYMQGTPQPVSPPSAVAPPAPNTTTSNGQVPQNDPVSGSLHPASINTTGVPVQASPAAADGSPAPVPPGMTLPGLLAMHGAGALAGIDAATLAGGGQALAYELFNRKIINENQYKQMLSGTGATQPMVADIGAAATVKGHEIAAAAELAKQRIVTGEGARQFNQSLERTLGPDGQPIFTPRISAAGQPAYEPTVAATVASAAAQPAYLQPGGPNTPVTMSTVGAAQGKQVSQPTVDTTIAGHASEYGVFTSPTDPLRRVNSTAGAAAAAGLIPVPKTTDEQIALMNSAYAMEQDPVKRQQLFEAMTQLAAMPKGPVGAKEAWEQQQVDYKTAQQFYPQPDPATKLGGGQWYITEPVMFNPEAETAINVRQRELQRTDRRLAVNPTEARSAAIRALQGEKQLPTAAEINELRRTQIRHLTGTDPRLESVQAPGGTTATPHLMIGLKPKAGTAATPGPTPGTPIGKAPAGTPDGPQTIGGKPVMVRSGIVYAQ
jgi:hypothetical protein